jgi:integrase
MKIAKIRINPITVRGERYWRLTYPLLGGGYKQQAFKLKTEAEREMAKKKAEIASYGAAAASIPDSLRVAAVEGHRELKEYGKTLRDAVDFYVAHLKSMTGGKDLKEAVDEFVLEIKATKSDRYYRSIKNRLETMVKRLPAKCTTTQVTSVEVASILKGFSAAATKRSYKANMRRFFNWCKTDKGYCQTNPLEDSPRITSDKEKDVTVLVPSELCKLLEECDEAILPGVVLAAFCGLRQAEISRLDWAAIKLDRKLVTIKGDVAKTGSRRVVPIPDNAVDWLTPLAKTTGAVWPAGDEYRKPWNIARLRCGWGPFQSTCAAVNAAQKAMGEAKRKKLKPWPDNALRHSAISYKLALTADLATVATEAGNSPSMVKKHYDAVVEKPEAETWFAIRPAEVASGKVARFSKVKAA